MSGTGDTDHLFGFPIITSPHVPEGQVLIMRQDTFVGLGGTPKDKRFRARVKRAWKELTER